VPERDFKLPDLGEGLTEGEVVRWLVSEGDTVTLNQPVVEVETAKAVVEIPAPYAGRVTKLHAAEGETLDVGAPLLSVDTTADAAGGSGGLKSEAATPVVGDRLEPSGSPPANSEPGMEGFASPAADEPASAATLVGPGERQQARRRRPAAAAAGRSNRGRRVPSEQAWRM
jgi:pyruvate dehydrogenase E2 component (dihydrolipoamide acetyltransferase)